MGIIATMEVLISTDIIDSIKQTIIITMITMQQPMVTKSPEIAQTLLPGTIAKMQKMVNFLSREDLGEKIKRRTKKSMKMRS